MPRKLVFLINLGTPDSPSVTDVRRYLREFLMDKYVIDIPFWRRWLLVNCIIAPFRAPQSAKIYRQVWTDKGSPLKFYGDEFKDLVQKALGNEYKVIFAMRYKHPSIRKALNEIKSESWEEIIVLPLYPQYAQATTKSTIEKVNDELKRAKIVSKVRAVDQFFNHPRFIEAFAEIGRRYMQRNQYDHFVFSYHGLPERQIRKAAIDNYCQLNEKCCSVYHSKNKYCYRAQCFETTRLIAKALQIPKEKYTVCFQSRLGKDPWIKPYTDQLIPGFAKQGIKNVLVFSPSFVADCLETTIEIGVEYKKLFQDNAGERWDLVESLNTNDVWVDAVKQMVLTGKS